MRFLEKLGITMYGIWVGICAIAVLALLIRLFGGVLKGLWWNLENWLGL